MATRKIISFDVCNTAEGDKFGVRKSFFFSDKTYNIGDKFMHHYYNIECVVTKVEDKTY